MIWSLKMRGGLILKNYLLFHLIHQFPANLFALISRIIQSSSRLRCWSWSWRRRRSWSWRRRRSWSWRRAELEADIFLESITALLPSLSSDGFVVSFDFRSFLSALALFFGGITTGLGVFLLVVFF